MKLRVLGSSAAYPRVRGACSGYLLGDGRTKVMVDAGTGTMANLLACLDPWDLAGIFISHAHFDHCADLYPLQLFYRLADHKRDLPKRVWAPPGVADMLYAIDGGTERIDSVYEFIEHEDGADRLVDGLGVRLAKVPHGEMPSFAMRFSGSAELTYSSDCEASEALVELARGSDVLLAEASAGAEGKILPGHMDAPTAARVGKDAGVGALMLAHLWPTYSWDLALAAARRVFDGPVSAAIEDTEMAIGEAS
jgi:ribonuclease BN (tRNA processing enzyme)